MFMGEYKIYILQQRIIFFKENNQMKFEEVLTFFASSLVKGKNSPLKPQSRPLLQSDWARGREIDQTTLPGETQRDAFSQVWPTDLQ